MQAYIFHVILPVAAGGVIYLTLRGGHLPVFDALANGLLHAEKAILWHRPLPGLPILPSWFSASLPDALWSYACVALALVCWRDGPRFLMVFWLGVAMALALGFELGQWLQIIPGTFCPLDAVFTLAAAGLALLLARPSRTGKEP